MQNYCILIRAHIRGNFPSEKCSLESVNSSVQISSSQLLLSKRYSRLKLLFYNRFSYGGFLGSLHRKSIVKSQL